MPIFGKKARTESVALVRNIETGAGQALDCVIDPDNSYIVSANGDGTVIKWDIATGNRVAVFTGHEGPAESCAVSQDGSFVVSTGWDGTVKVWDTGSGQLLDTLVGHADPVPACAIGPDGSFIVSAGTDGTVRVWDRATGRERAVLSLRTGSVNDCCLTPDGKLVIMASGTVPWLKESEDNSIRFWNPSRGGQRGLMLEAHEDSVTACVMTAEGRFVISASADSTLKVWAGRTDIDIMATVDVVTGSGHDAENAPLIERVTLRGHADAVNDCDASPDSRFVASASADGTVKLWSSANGAERTTLRGHRKAVNACAFSPDGRYLVSAGADGTLKVWDAVSAAVWGRG